MWAWELLCLPKTFVCLVPNWGGSYQLRSPQRITGSELVYVMLLLPKTIVNLSFVDEVLPKAVHWQLSLWDYTLLTSLQINLSYIIHRPNTLFNIDYQLKHLKMSDLQRKLEFWGTFYRIRLLASSIHHMAILPISEDSLACSVFED